MKFFILIWINTPNSSKSFLNVLLPPSNEMSMLNLILLALFICGIIHEFGHGIAASREQVRVNGFGIFVMFIFPGAYVDLCSDHLKIISPMSQLRIFCAGVWHNIVLVLVAALLIELHPLFLNAFFDKNVYVSIINQVSRIKTIFPSFYFK